MKYSHPSSLARVCAHAPSWSQSLQTTKYVLNSEKTTKLCCSIYSYFMVKSKGELYYQSTIWNYSLNLQSKVVRCMVASPQSKSIESEFSKQRGTVVASPLSKIIVWIFKAKGNSVASPLSEKESWRINVLFQVKNMFTVNAHLMTDVEQH